MRLLLIFVYSVLDVRRLSKLPAIGFTEPTGHVPFTALLANDFRLAENDFAAAVSHGLCAPCIDPRATGAELLRVQQRELVAVVLTTWTLLPPCGKGAGGLPQALRIQG